MINLVSGSIPASPIEPIKPRGGEVEGARACADSKRPADVGDPPRIPVGGLHFRVVVDEKAPCAIDDFVGSKPVKAGLSTLIGFDRSSDRVEPFKV